MAGQAGAALIEGQKHFLFKVSALCQSGVYSGAGVALGADKAVPAGHGGVLGVDVHLLKIQHSQQLRDGQAAANVAHAKTADAANHAAAQVLGDLLQITAQFDILLLKC